VVGKEEITEVQLKENSIRDKIQRHRREAECQERQPEVELIKHERPNIREMRSNKSIRRDKEVTRSPERSNISVLRPNISAKSCHSSRIKTERSRVTERCRRVQNELDRPDAHTDVAARLGVACVGYKQRTAATRLKGKREMRGKISTEACHIIHTAQWNRVKRHWENQLKSAHRSNIRERKLKTRYTQRSK